MYKLLSFCFCIFITTSNLVSQWQVANSIPSQKISCLTKKSDTIYAGGVGNVFISTDDGVNWSNLSNGLPASHILSILRNDNNIFVGTYGSGIYKSSDNGLTWIQTTLNSGKIQTLHVTGTSLYAGTPTGVFKSIDNGLTWVLSNTGLVSIDVLSFASLNNKIMAGTSGGVFVTDDGALNWYLFGLEGKTILSLEEKDSIIYAGTYVGIFSTNNLGLRWDTVGVLFKEINSILTLNDYIFAGSDGVYRFENGETGWQSFSEGINNNSVLGLINNNSFLIAGCIDGLRIRPLSEVLSVVYIKNTIFQNSYLLQNYPNPFNPTTTIKYSLPEKSNIIIIIYDALGREINKLVDEEKPAGEYEVNWKAENHPSGVYFCRMKTGNFVETRKLILMK